MQATLAELREIDFGGYLNKGLESLVYLVLSCEVHNLIPCGRLKHIGLSILRC